MQTMRVAQVDGNRSPGCAVHGKVWMHGTHMRMDSQQSSPSIALALACVRGCSVLM